ncbi:translation termination factor GTPase eRF3, partial [Physocladia obscura]
MADDEQQQQSGSQSQNNYYGQQQQQQQQAQPFVFRPATEFVPSSNAGEFIPGGYAPQYNQQYNQPAQYQTYNTGYNQGYTNTQYQQQQQYFAPNQNQTRGGGFQQQYNNSARYNNNNYYQQQPQAYVAPQQQQAYVAPQQQQAYKAPSGPAKSISIGGGSAKSISIGGGAAAAAPAKSISIGGGPAKSISIGGGPAKSISTDAKKDPISKKDATASPKIPAKAAVPEKKEKATVVVEKRDAAVAEKKEVVVAPTEKSEPEVKSTPVIETEKTDGVFAATAAVAALTVEGEDDTPVELSEAMKEHLNIVFIGHVDAGKSTMGGHILFLTGMVDKRTLEKYEKEAKEAGRESWYLSWALDLNSEERAKGKTVEYGRGYFETEKRRFTILDAPGHKNYVPSMMQGAAQADVGVLVISARKGEFETGFEKGGQTREHAMLCKTVGVKRMILVVNKMDDPTVLWDKSRYDECVGKILPFLKGVGYNLGTDLDVLPISGFTGANIKDRLNKDVCDWYSGPSLLELLDDMNVGDRKIDGPLLMPISDKFKDMGTVITGKIESGKVRKGQNVIIMPNKFLHVRYLPQKVAEVAAIWMEETERNIAISGDNVRIRLKNVEEEDVLSGFVMCSIQKPVHAVTTFEARLAIVEYKSIMCAGYTAVFNAHPAVDEIKNTDLVHKIDKKSG